MRRTSSIIIPSPWGKLRIKIKREASPCGKASAIADAG